MSYSRIIHDYLDGQLGTADEDMLFAELAHNQDLRNEFNQQMKLSLAAQFDMGSITPPMESTNMIFSSLGFTIPSADYNKETGVKSGIAGAGLWLALKKYGSIIATAIISSALSYLVFMIYFNGTPRESSNFAANTNVPVVSSFENHSTGNSSEAQIRENRNSRLQTLNNGRNTSNTTRQINNMPAISLTESSIDENVSVEEAPATLSVINKTQVIINNIDNRISYSPNSRFASLTIVSPSGFSGSEPYGIALELKGISGTSYPEPDVKAGTGFDLKNFSVTALYNLADEHSIGIEFGKENLSQVYPVADGKFVRSANPTLFTYGALYRYTPSYVTIGDFIRTYGQLFAGGTVYGPIFKYQAGFMISPLNNFYLNIGMGGSYLFYPIREKWYNTNKYGISAGLGVRF